MASLPSAVAKSNLPPTLAGMQSAVAKTDLGPAAKPSRAVGPRFDRLRKLNDVWALCGKWEEPPHPHRFRHGSFGFCSHMEYRQDVAELIGDTEEMLLKDYARWVPER
jgi:hypothetical protein